MNDVFLNSTPSPCVECIRRGKIRRRGREDRVKCDYCGEGFIFSHKQ